MARASRSSVPFILAGDGCSPACQTEDPDTCPGVSILLTPVGQTITGNTRGASNEGQPSVFSSRSINAHSGSRSIESPSQPGTASTTPSVTPTARV